MYTRNMNVFSTGYSGQEDGTEWRRVDRRQVVVARKDQIQHLYLSHVRILVLNT